MNDTALLCGRDEDVSSDLQKAYGSKASFYNLPHTIVQ
jgi:hypothetical protein